MNNKLWLFIVGIVVGGIIGFLVANSQYQNQATNPSAAANAELPPNHPPVDESAKAAISSSSTGPLEAFGAKKSSEAGKDNSKDGSDTGKKIDVQYKNIKILKDLPAEQLPVVMQSFSEALGVNCSYCHVSAETADKDDKAAKEIARKMLIMVREINKGYPTEGQVTCFTCHRGSIKPAS